MIEEIKKMREDIESNLKKGFGDLQQKNDVAIEAIQKGEEVASSLKADIENQKGEIERIAEQVQTIEQKGVKLQGTTEHKSFVDFIKSNDDYSAVQKGLSSAFIHEFKKDDLSSMLTTKADTSALRSETVNNSIQTEPRQELRIRDLLTTIPLGTNDYTYFKENSATLNAGMVAEGGIKPEQTSSFSEVNDTVKKIAVWHRVTMEQMQDHPQVMAYIRDLLRYDIKLKEEEQLLKGDGTGQNLNGIYTQATAYDAAGLAGGSDTALDTLRRMIYQVRKQSRTSADAVVMTDLDWMNIELMKENTNAYLFSNIQGTVAPLVWGRPVVVSDSLDDSASEVLVGNFARSAKVYDRMGYTVKAGMINDDFIKNQSVVLAEERIGLGVNRPNCLVKGTLA